MKPEYLHLAPEANPPKLVIDRICAVIVAEILVGPEWRNRVAEWLVDSGCLYVVAWGVDCKLGHDAVDWSVLEQFDYGNTPDDRFVMTTWHDRELLSEALWFARQCASHPDVELTGTLILHVAGSANPTALLAAFDESQVFGDDD